MDDSPPDNIRDIQNKQNAIEAAKHLEKEYEQKAKMDCDRVSYVIPDSILEVNVKPETKSLDLEQPASKEEPNFEKESVSDKESAEQRTCEEKLSTEKEAVAEQPASKEEPNFEKESVSDKESAEQRTCEEKLSTEKEAVAPMAITNLELRLPNVRQGVRSPGLEIKRAQDPKNGEKRRWEKYYIDDDAGVTEEELGIDYNIKSGLLHLTPQKHGDFIICFTINDPKYPKLKCKLTVIPDPKTLWTATDPPADALYPKDHKDSNLLFAGERIIVGASVRGRSHARDGTHRDDDFLVCELVDDWNLMVVADGAGSAKFSRKGSHILVETMHSFISEKLCDPQALDMLNTEAFDVINGDSTIDRAKNLLVLGAYSSLMKIQEEAKSMEAKAKDYNTTIISCLFKEFGEKTFVYSFCIGDGALFVLEVDSKKIFSLNVADSGEFAGQTRFLTTPEVWQDHGVYERVKSVMVQGPFSIIGMTDGVSDPLLPDVDEIKDYANIETLLNGLEGEDPVEGLLDVLRKIVKKSDATDLEEWLDFYVAKHHDDRSIAVAFAKQFLS
jgi:serine/threonine protein phosphatase PrpC